MRAIFINAQGFHIPSPHSSTAERTAVDTARLSPWRTNEMQSAVPVRFLVQIRVRGLFLTRLWGHSQEFFHSLLISACAGRWNVLVPV